MRKIDILMKEIDELKVDFENKIDKKVQRTVVFPKKYKNIVLISYNKDAFDIQFQ